MADPTPQVKEWVNDLSDDERYADDNGLPVSLENVLAAASRIRGSVRHTTCVHSKKLSALFGFECYLKNEFEQSTGSFKERGACNALQLLSREQRARGVVAASAGNHALALAEHGARLGIPVTVVMPLVAPLNKVHNCRELGADVIVHGQTFTEAYHEARRIEQERGATYVHGFNDVPIIAGQASVGLEVLDDVPDVDAVIVPVGGGGLIAGVAMAIKHRRPEVEVVGVEPSAYACLLESLHAGTAVDLPVRSTIADGLAIRRVGDNVLPLARRYVDRVVSVAERHIALGVLRLIELHKIVAEGGAASALAPFLENAGDDGATRLTHLRGKKVVLIVTGGNIDVSLLGRLIDYGLAADGRLVTFQAEISDRPGGLRDLCAVIAQTGASVKGISHERTFADAFDRVFVQGLVETRDEAHAGQLIAAIRDAGISVTRTFSMHGHGLAASQVLRPSNVE